MKTFVLFASDHRRAGSCLKAGNGTQPADCRDIQDINTYQAAFETFTLLDKRDFEIRIRVFSQGHLFGCRMWHGSSGF